MSIKFTDQNFKEEVIENQEAVLVDFWAPWCAPCRMLTPVIDELAKEYEGKVKVGKVNVDENPATAQAYRIMSIPSVKLFKGGKEVDQFVGVRPKNEIVEMLDKHA